MDSSNSSSSGSSSSSRSLRITHTEEVHNVLGVPTLHLVWNALPAAKALCNHKRTVFVMIPGNPGVIHYYEDFLFALYYRLRGKVSVIGVEHAGHTSARKETVLFNLEDQVQHKVAVLDRLIEENPNTRFILGGHSVGAYICLQLLKRRPNLEIARVFQLLPTVKEIGSTPNGRRLRPVFWTGSQIFVAFLASLLKLLPSGVRYRAVKQFTRHPPYYAAITSNKLISYQCARSALFMAANEMKSIRELDQETVMKHGDKLVFFYGQTDGWVPLSHYEEMKQLIPQAEIFLCNREIPHAFVLGYGADLASSVANVIFKHHYTGLAELLPALEEEDELDDSMNFDLRGELPSEIWTLKSESSLSELLNDQ